MPTDLSTTTARPDVVLVSEESVTMLELTINSNSKEAVIKAKERKTNKPNYSLLIGDLEEHRLLAAINLPSNFVGVSAMLHVEPFLKENVLVWSILQPLKTIKTHFSGFRVRLRSEHLSSMVSKRD